ASKVRGERAYGQAGHAGGGDDRVGGGTRGGEAANRVAGASDRRGGIQHEAAVWKWSGQPDLELLRRPGPGGERGRADAGGDGVRRAEGDAHPGSSAGEGDGGPDCPSTKGSEFGSFEARNETWPSSERSSTSGSRLR